MILRSALALHHSSLSLDTKVFFGFKFIRFEVVPEVALPQPYEASLGETQL